MPGGNKEGEGGKESGKGRYRLLCTTSCRDHTWFDDMWRAASCLEPPVALRGELELTVGVSSAIGLSALDRWLSTAIGRWMILAPARG